MVLNMLVFYMLCRLVLLLQLMGAFVELSCSKTGIPNRSSTTSTSVGPIAKKYWSRMIQLCTSLTQMMSQVSTVLFTNISFQYQNSVLIVLVLLCLFKYKGWCR